MDDLKIFNVRWSSQSAGPSLDDNKRTEIFLAGCRKAAEGHPCKGCFNQEIWSDKNYVGLDSPRQAFNRIRHHAPNKYITFVGGEPLDQIEPLSDLCRMLHKDGYHIIVITHFLVEPMFFSVNCGDKKYKKLLENVDAIVDGEYMEDRRIWDDSLVGDGLHDVIGSGNQRIWDFKRYHDGKTGTEVEQVPAEKLMCWSMNKDNDFVFVYKNQKDMKEDEEHYRELEAEK